MHRIPAPSAPHHRSNGSPNGRAHTIPVPVSTPSPKQQGEQPPVDHSHSRWLILAMSGIGGVEFSVVMPSMWHYVEAIAPEPISVYLTDEKGFFRLDLDPVTTLLFAQTAFTFTSMCAKPIVGALSDKVGFARLFAVSSFFGALGGLLYALAGQKALTGGAHVGVGALLVARMLGGFAGAMSTLGNAYIVRTTPDAAQRGQQLALIAAATLVGVFVGPAVVPLFAKVHDVKVGILTIDELNLPGFFLFTIFLVAPGGAALYTPRAGAAKRRGGVAAGAAAAGQWHPRVTGLRSVRRGGRLVAPAGRRPTWRLHPLPQLHLDLGLCVRDVLDYARCAGAHGALLRVGPRSQLVPLPQRRHVHARRRRHHG